MTTTTKQLFLGAALTVLFTGLCPGGFAHADDSTSDASTGSAYNSGNDSTMNGTGVSTEMSKSTKATTDTGTMTSPGNANMPADTTTTTKKTMIKKHVGTSSGSTTPASETTIYKKKTKKKKKGADDTAPASGGTDSKSSSGSSDPAMDSIDHSSQSDMSGAHTGTTDTSSGSGAGTGAGSPNY